MIVKWIINEIVWEGMLLINLAQDSDLWWVVVKTLMRPWISENMAHFLIIRGPVSASGRALLHLVCKCNYSCVGSGEDVTR
jgi:hypothetical protein